MAGSSKRLFVDIADTAGIADISAVRSIVVDDQLSTTHVSMLVPGSPNQLERGENTILMTRVEGLESKLHAIAKGMVVGLQPAQPMLLVQTLLDVGRLALRSVWRCPVGHLGCWVTPRHTILRESRDTQELVL